MSVVLAYMAGFGCSVAYGIATILEQIAAQRQSSIDSLHPSHLLGLLRQAPYIMGIVLDLVGWGLFLVAVRVLPLFLAISFVTFSLVVTAFIAEVFMSVKTSKRERLAMLGLIVGIVLLSFSAQPTEVHHAATLFSLMLKVSPAILAFIGLSLLRAPKGRGTAMLLGACAGLTFGATGLIARIINFSDFGIKTFIQVFVVSLIAYAILGAIFLAAALQRGTVNTVNSALYSVELIVPSLLGIFFLQDHARNGLWPLMIVCFVLIAFSTLIISMEDKAEN